MITRTLPAKMMTKRFKLMNLKKIKNQSKSKMMKKKRSLKISTRFK